MSKLSKKQEKDLQSVGLKATSVEDARAKMIEYLKKNEIEGVEDDSFEELYAMVEVLYQDSDDEMSEASAEVEEDEDDDAVSIEEMKEALLESGVTKKELKSMSEKNIILAYNDLLFEEEEEEEVEEEEEEEEAPAPKKSAKKTSKKVEEVEDEDEEEEVEEEEAEDDEEEEEAPAPKKSAKKNAEKVEEKPSKKSAKKIVEKTAKVKKEKKSTKKIDPYNNEEDRKMFDLFKKKLTKLFSKHELKFDFLVKSGIVVRLIGSNSSRVLLCFNSMKYNDAGEPVGKFYFPTVKNEELLTDVFGEDIEIMPDWSGKLKIKNLPLSEIISGIETNVEVVENIISAMNKKDEKLGKNRDKMEKDLKESKKSKVEEIKKSAKKKVEEVEDEEEETPAPKKSAKKKVEEAPAPKKTKKVVEVEEEEEEEEEAPAPKKSAKKNAKKK